MGGEGDLVAPRLARGCRCFAAWRDGSLAGYGWLSAGPEWIGEVGLEITPPAGDAYIWNCVTIPEHRRRGVFRGLLAHICGVAAAERMRRLWIAGLAGTAEGALPPLGFEPVLAIEGADARPLGPLAPEGFAALGISPGEPFRPGPPRRH